MLAHYLILALVIGAACAIFYIIWTKALGWTIPDWLIKVFWICVAVVVGIWAIRFVMTL